MLGKIFSVLLGLAALPAFAGGCADLSRWIDRAPAGPVFLASFPTVESGPLHDAAYLYDNAAAAIALVGCGEKDKAARIGNAILWAMEHDRFWHDGRLRNAYLAGAVTAKLPGWWDAKQNKWLEDRYQVGSDNGNMAWAMLAMLAVGENAGAARLGDWVAQWRKDGFTGGTFGHEPNPEIRTWKSTEHNTDLAAAYNLLAARTGNEHWRDLAGSARNFVETMWDPARQCFVVGTAEDGVTRNPMLALDTEIWPLTALPGMEQYRGAIATAERLMSVGGGFAYGENRDGVWTEGTGQIALLLELLGQQDKAKVLLATIEAQRAPNGGYFASGAKQLPTGFALDTDPTQPRLYFHLPHLGATAWAALAERGFNPFTLTHELPQ